MRRETCPANERGNQSANFSAFVNPNTDKGKLAAYLKWIQGDEGQRIAEEAGFHPLPAYLRPQ